MTILTLFRSVGSIDEVLSLFPSFLPGGRLAQRKRLPAGRQVGDLIPRRCHTVDSIHLGMTVFILMT